MNKSQKAIVEFAIAVIETGASLLEKLDWEMTDEHKFLRRLETAVDTLSQVIDRQKNR